MDEPRLLLKHCGVCLDWFASGWGSLEAAADAPTCRLLDGRTLLVELAFMFGEHYIGESPGERKETLRSAAAPSG